MTKEFMWTTISYYLRPSSRSTGITVSLGFISRRHHGQTFYLLPSRTSSSSARRGDGRQQPAARRHEPAQAAVVGGVGYCLGVGGAVLYSVVTAAGEGIRGLLPDAAGCSSASRWQ